MARKDIINQDGTPKWDTIAGFKERLDGHDTAVASNTSSLADNAKQITDRTISVKDKQFGAKGDGVTDDTVALQSFFNYVVNNHLEGKIPAGTYLISDEITIPSMWGWTITGAGANVSIIKQKTDNKNILHWLSTPSYAHSILFKGLTFDYVNLQPSTNTNANPFYIETMIYESTFDEIAFNGGYYGIFVKSGVGNPWGCTFDNLRFGSNMSGGAINMSTINAVPNNHFGRLYVSAQNMIGPIFYIKGYNCVIDTIEVIAANQGAQLLVIQPGAKIEIGAIKLENGVYNTSKTLIELQGGAIAHIGSINIGGDQNMTFNPSTGVCYIVNCTSGAAGRATIGHIELGGTSIANTYAFGTMGNSVLHSYNIATTGFNLFNQGGATGSENVIVNDHLNNHVSQNKGDADYTIVLGDPNTLSFETALTLPRTVTLPSVNNSLFNGLKYRIRSYGAINGTNVINIVCNGVTKATLSTDKAVIELAYRRNGSYVQNGWVVTDYVTLP